MDVFRTYGGNADKYCKMHAHGSLEKWDSDKPWLPSFLAKLFLPAAELLYGLLDAVRTSQRLDGLGPLPPVKSWLRLYRAQDRVFGALFEEVISTAGFRALSPGFGKEIWRMMRRNPALTDQTFFVHAPAEDRKHLPKPLRRFMALTRLGEREYKKLLKNPGVVPKDSSPNQETHPIDPELQFFLRVFVPCWVVGKTLPADLMRRARQADLDALDLLLRIDKTVIHDPKISEIIRTESNNPRRARFNRIAKSFSSFLPAIKKSKIKLGLISFLSAAFSQFGGIDTPELRKLFDSYAQTKTKGKTLADPDLPPGLEAFSKAIRRGRKEWGGAQRPPKKSA